MSRGGSREGSAGPADTGTPNTQTEEDGREIRALLMWPSGDLPPPDRTGRRSRSGGQATAAARQKARSNRLLADNLLRVCAWLPADLVERIDAEAKGMGQSRENRIAAALKTAYHHDAPP